MFFAWVHTEDVQYDHDISWHAANIMSRHILEGPFSVLTWRDSIAPDGVLVSSLVEEYGPEELVRRIASAVRSLTKRLRDADESTRRTQWWSLYMCLISKVFLPGICCHVKCAPFLVEYDMLSVIADYGSAHTESWFFWPCSASVLLFVPVYAPTVASLICDAPLHRAIEKHHRKPDGTPGTWETVKPETFGRILMMGMFYIYAEGGRALPEGKRMTIM